MSKNSEVDVSTGMCWYNYFVLQHLGVVALNSSIFSVSYRIMIFEMAT